MSNANVRKFKIGLLLNGPYTRWPVCELVEWAQNQPNIEMSHLLMYSNKPQSQGIIRRMLRSFMRDGWNRTVSTVLFRLILCVEKQILKRYKIYQNYRNVIDLRLSIKKHITIEAIKSGYVYQFSANDIRRIKELELDLLIKYGSEILTGDILSSARHGVISLRYGDDRLIRGGPAGFWECYYRWPKTGFAIQRLTQELDGGDVLVRGYFRTQLYFLVNQAHLCKKANPHLFELIKNIFIYGHSPETKPSFCYSGPVYKAPNVCQSIVYGAKLSFRKFMENFF